MPFTFACAPSERFARGAVELLYRTGVVTDIAFGVDTEHTDILKDLVDIEPDEEVLRAGLKDGKSYPAARADAIIKSINTGVCNNVTAVSEVLRMPNSILALDYLKALREINAGFRVHMIRRVPGEPAYIFAGNGNPSPLSFMYEAIPTARFPAVEPFNKKKVF